MKDLRSELSGDFKQSILGCFETPARYDAWEVKNAIYVRGYHWCRASLSFAVKSKSYKSRSQFFLGKNKPFGLKPDTVPLS